jgi:DNA uptake protein ComE-like DNA-binding protein
VDAVHLVFAAIKARRVQNRIQSLDQQQLRKIFQEATLDDGTSPIIGKVNLNTVSPAILRAMLPDDPISADAIIAERSASEFWTPLPSQTFGIQVDHPSSDRSLGARWPIRRVTSSL